MSAMGAMKRRISELLDEKPPEPKPHRRWMTPRVKEYTSQFRPWDRDAFLTRLQTFAPPEWPRAKFDAPVNELEWARRGWVCVGRNTVKCGVCDRQLVVTIEPHSAEARAVIVDKYKALITSAHGDSCAWRRRGCDLAIYRLPLIASSMSRAYQRRLQTLRLEEMASLELVLPDSSLHGSEKANELARFGWEGSQDRTLLCRLCFRRLGLWAYVKEQAPRKLDVVREHLSYCPWISRQVSHGSQGSEDIAWKYLKRVLASEEIQIPTADMPSGDTAALKQRLSLLRSTLFSRPPKGRLKPR